MFSKIFDLAISNGLWATMFVALFLYVLKDASNREKKYQITISTLSKHLDVVNDIDKKVDEINLKFKTRSSGSAKLNEKKLKEENI